MHQYLEFNQGNQEHKETWSNGSTNENHVNRQSFRRDRALSGTQNKNTRK